MSSDRHCGSMSSHRSCGPCTVGSCPLTEAVVHVLSQELWVHVISQKLWVHVL